MRGFELLSVQGAVANKGPILHMTKLKDLSLLIATLVLGALAFSSCMGPKGNTPQDKRVYAEHMRDAALAALYVDEPEIKKEVEASVGYGVFSVFSIHPGLLSFASGYGVLTNKASGKETHLKWTRLTIGPGLAVKGLYGVIVFNDSKELEEVERGTWAPFGQMEASFKFGDFGGGVEKAWTFNKGFKSHYFTHTGVALELELIGFGKLSLNSELNDLPAQ